MHTPGAECVLRATYQGRGSRRKSGNGGTGQMEGHTETERGVRGGERSRASTEESRVDLEREGEQRLRWQRGLL